MNERLILPAANTFEMLFMRVANIPVPTAHDGWDDVVMVGDIDFCGSGVGKARLNIHRQDITNHALLQVGIPDVDGFDLCWVLSAGPKSRLIRAVFPTGPRTRRCSE